MNIDVDPDWWKDLFDEVYLVTDARSVDNRAVTCREIDAFSAMIPLEPHQRVLDLCGGHGRHAIELCRRGFTACTVLDFSPALLAVGARTAAAGGYRVAFVRGDARDTGLRGKAFDHVLILGNSLGYILEPEADLKILRESRRLLKSGGWLLLDVADGGVARTDLAPRAWHEIGDDVVVCREREVGGSRIRAREMVLSKTRGMVRDNTYGIRLYRAADLTALAAQAGFTAVHARSGASALEAGADIGCMNHRVVVTARKP
jgi:D-alanine-D-alanine ligase